MGIFDRRQPRPTASEVAARAITLHAVVLYAMTAPPRDTLAQIMAGWTPQDREEFEAGDKQRQEEFWQRLGSLRSQMSPWEREFAASTMSSMTQPQQVNASWRLESFQVLLWALGCRAELPGFDTQADPEILKNYAPSGLEAFVKEAKLRPAEAIDELRSTAELWHWRSRTRQLIEDGPELQPTPEMLSMGMRSYDDIVRMAAESAAGEGRLVQTLDGDFVALGKPYRALTGDEWSVVRSITMERHFALNWLCAYAPRNKWDETPTDT